MTNPMCRDGTPVEDYLERFGLWVKREDLCCPGGPNFSKTRGVYAHVKGRREPVIGVLDTNHSQGGWAVARACQLLGKQCVLYYPVRKSERDDHIKPQQEAALRLGAQLVPLQAGRSAVLYHTAKKRLSSLGAASTYMMPNALKLPEMITETVAEVERTTLPPVSTLLISASSGTIAAGVILGLQRKGWVGVAPSGLPVNKNLIVHQGYSRSEPAIRSYMDKMALGFDGEGIACPVTLVDEKYSYADSAKPGEQPPFPCNEYYDLKAFRWWVREGRNEYGTALLWNIG